MAYISRRYKQTVVDLVAYFYHDQGYSLAQVAQRMGLSWAAARHIVRHCGLTRTAGRPRVPLPMAAMCNWYEDGRSTYWIARRMKTSASTVKNRLREAGVRIRPRGKKEVV